MTLDPVILSRLQFFWVVSFHILLPAFTVGLACYITVLEGLYLKTKDHAYFRISVLAWCRESLCRSSSGPTGVASRTPPRMSLAHLWLMKASLPSSWKQASWVFSSSGASSSRHGLTSSRPPWWRWGPSFRRSGYSP